ncbi:MAG: hypothetical protein JHC33_08350, partial [Ignisphaera sp.]|nr:hypothetical protein [Ignisphaera sp.]
MATMSRFHTFLVLVLLLLIIGTLTIHQNWFVGAEMATLPTNISYAYTVNLSGIGISPVFVVGLSSTRIAVAGFVRGVSAIAILDVSNPYEDPKIVQLYALT